MDEDEKRIRRRKFRKALVLTLFVAFLGIALYTAFDVISWCYSPENKGYVPHGSVNGIEDFLCAVQYVDAKQLGPLQIVGIIAMIILALVQLGESIYDSQRKDRY